MLLLSLDNVLNLSQIKTLSFDEILRKFAKSLGEDKNGNVDETESEKDNTIEKQAS